MADETDLLVDQLELTLRQVMRAGRDSAGLLGLALARAEAREGRPFYDRPGSWEYGHLEALAAPFVDLPDVAVPAAEARAVAEARDTLAETVEERIADVEVDWSRRPDEERPRRMLQDAYVEGLEDAANFLRAGAWPDELVVVRDPEVPQNGERVRLVYSDGSSVEGWWVFPEGDDGQLVPGGRPYLELDDGSDVLPTAETRVEIVETTTSPATAAAEFPDPALPETGAFRGAYTDGSPGEEDGPQD